MLAQGGRLVTERRMVADLYEFDLATFVWARVPPHPDDDVPGARYFHSTDACESAVYYYYYFAFLLSFRHLCAIHPRPDHMAHSRTTHDSQPGNGRRG